MKEERKAEMSPAVAMVDGLWQYEITELGKPGRPPRFGDRKRTIYTARIFTDILEELRAMADTKGVPLGDLLNEALTEYLSK